LDDLPLPLWVYIPLVIALLSLSAFFSGSETALFSLSRPSLRRMERETSKTSRLVCRLLARPYRLLTTILVGNTIVNVVFSAFVGIAVESKIASLGYSEGVSLAAATVAVTVMLLVLGEIGPKVLAVQHPERSARRVAAGVAFFYGLLRPVRALVLALARGVLGLTGASKLRADPFITEAELKEVVTEGELRGVLERDQRDMIHSILRFTDTKVADVLTPREKMVTLRAQVSLREAIEAAHRTGLSRIPVIGDSPDDVVGVVYVKDLLPYCRTGNLEIAVSKVARPAKFVAATTAVSRLLSEFRDNRVHIAIVREARGKTLGVVTIEDLLEEVVGEIVDERDEFRARRRHG
jgi:putative hemolysin